MLNSNLICFKSKPLVTGLIKGEEGIWLEIELLNGCVDIFYLDADKNQLFKKNIQAKNKIRLEPSFDYEIKGDDKCSGWINYYCQKHRYFTKKYDFSSIHSDLLYTYNNYIQKDANTSLNILDVGCGSGRNLLYLALEKHKVKGIDINTGALNRIKNISLEEKLDITTESHDLNQALTLNCEKFDFILSTVTLQFLNPERIQPLLEELISKTHDNGLHLLVYPVHAEEFNLPTSFKYLAKKNELYDFYHNKGFAILEYKETIGQLHRLDEFGRPIQGLFAYLLAQKIKH